MRSVGSAVSSSGSRTTIHTVSTSSPPPRTECSATRRRDTSLIWGGGGGGAGVRLAAEAGRGARRPGMPDARGNQVPSARKLSRAWTAARAAAPPFAAVPSCPGRRTHLWAGAVHVPGGGHARQRPVALQRLARDAHRRLAAAAAAHELLRDADQLLPARGVKHAARLRRGRGVRGWAIAQSAPRGSGAQSSGACSAQRNPCGSPEPGLVGALPDTSGVAHLPVVVQQPLPGLRGAALLV